MDNTNPDGPECIIATQKDWKQRQAIKEADPPRGRIPEKLSLRERMERKLLKMFVQQAQDAYLLFIKSPLAPLFQRGG
jgi:hypothetical protein